VPAPERLAGLRVVADPRALDALAVALAPNGTVLRFAPDEALVLGVGGISLDDPDAIVVEESGFVALAVDRARLERQVEWPLDGPGSLGQGKVAGVPAKVAWLPDGRAWVVTHAVYAHELQERLGWG
jgi:hypothetical protein